MRRLVAGLCLGIFPVLLTAERDPPPDGLLRVRDDPEREELSIELGPIDLPARTPHQALRQMPVQFGTVPFDLTIHGYRVELVDGDGRRVPQEILHHVNLLDPRSRELFLPIMRRVLAASHETRPHSVPGWLFGIPLRGGDPFIALTMLHNPTDREFRGVTVRLILEYERGEVLPLFRLYPFHLDVEFPVGSKAFDLPPGRTVRSWDGSPAIPGEIVGLGGHLHRHATRLTLEDLTTGEMLYDEAPVLSPDGSIAEVPVRRYYDFDLGLDLYPAHRYRVSVSYYNPTGDTIPDGGMGSVAGVFLPDEPWPAADPDDVTYRLDYEHVLRSVGAHGAHEARRRVGPAMASSIAGPGRSG